MNIYTSEVENINKSIALFNEYLANTHQIPEINTTSGFDAKNIVEILHGRWDDMPFPNSNSRGVYFIFGRHRVQSTKTGLYIGKASFGSVIGRRLYSWLHPHRSSEYFIMNYGEDEYILEYIASINFDTLTMPFMASALEEYLISSLTGKLNLLNGTGNSRRAEQVASCNPLPAAVLPESTVD